MNGKKMAKEIYKALGGKENIVANATCMTRLRIKVKENPDLSEIKKIEGVINVVESDTLQIILGPGTVNAVGVEFAKLTDIPLGFSKEKETASKDRSSGKGRRNNPVQKLLQKIADIFVPLLPGIIAAGFISGMTNIINRATGGTYNGMWWFEAIRTLGGIIFLYIPLYVGMNAAKEFGGTAVLGGITGSIFVNIQIFSSSFKAVGAMDRFLVLNGLYIGNTGGIMAALFMGIIVAFIEKGVRKIVPAVLDTFLTPLITLTTGLIIALLIIWPVGNIVTYGTLWSVDLFLKKLGPVGGYTAAALFLPLVSAGLHQVLLPVHILLNDPSGPSEGINYLLPMLMMAGGGQVGAGFAIYLKTKSKKLKRLAKGAIPAGILGMGEPLMYGVTLPLGKPFIWACVGSGFGGLLISLFHVGTISQGVSGILGLLIIVPEKWLYFLLSVLTAYISSFVLTYFFGVDDEKIEVIYGK